MNATQLGRLFGRSAMEMNKLLLAHGLVEGGPGAWRPTALGEGFAKWVDKDNGYRGVAYRGWSWLTWDDKVVEFLKDSLKVNPDGIVTGSPAAVATAIVAPASALSDQSGSLLRKNKVFAGAVITTLAVASTPLAKRAYAKVKPTVTRFRADFAEGHGTKTGANEVAEEPNVSGGTEDDSKQ